MVKITHHINVLEGPSKGVGQSEVTYLMVLIVFTVVLIACGGYSFWKAQQLSAQNKILEQLNAEVTKLQLQVEPKHKQVSGQDVLKKLGYPIAWSALLKKTISLIPNSVQISELGASIGTHRALKLIANTENKNSMVLLRADLGRLPECQDIRIFNLNETSFHLECVLP